MALLKKGSLGPEVKGIQLRLNTRLKPSPKLKADGNFGHKTEEAVIRLQKESGLTPDGIVGPKTRAALTALPKGAAPPNLAKFVAELGTAEDFVQHVAGVEATRSSRGDVLEGLSDFFGTSGGKRYLLVQGDKVGVIDFRHFFAAAGESYNSAKSAKSGLKMGGSPGKAVLLGVGNEVAQCMSEAYEGKFNSCFSKEDLGSNRLGAEFGELVKVKEAEASTQKVSQLLRAYLAKSQPVGPDKVSSIKTAGRWDQALEALAAIVAGIGDILVPRAY